jgi:hypothetical protein
VQAPLAQGGARRGAARAHQRRVHAGRELARLLLLLLLLLPLLPPPAAAAGGAGDDSTTACDDCSGCGCHSGGGGGGGDDEDDGSTLYHTRQPNTAHSIVRMVKPILGTGLSDAGLLFLFLLLLLVWRARLNDKKREDEE